MSAADDGDERPTVYFTAADLVQVLLLETATRHRALGEDDAADGCQEAAAEVTPRREA